MFLSGDPEYKPSPGFPLKARGNDILLIGLRMLMKPLLEEDYEAKI